MNEAKLIKTIFLRATPERVWAFLTEPELLGRWFHASRDPLVAGEPYELLKDGTDERNCWGRVIEAQPPQRLVQTFTHDHLQGHETRVQWTLTEVEGGTRLELVHDGFEGTEANLLDMLTGHDKGWDEHFGRLRERVVEAAAAA